MNISQNYWQIYKNQLKREYILKIGQPRLLINSFLLFLMIILFFPLMVPAGVTWLKTAIPGLLCISMLFAGLLSSELLFYEDYENGIFEQWIISGYPLSIFISAKLSVHWLLNIFPLIIATPVIGVLFDFTIYEHLVLFIIVISATPAIYSLCALVASFGVPLKQKGIFMALILLPLSVPVLIIASSAINAAFEDIAVNGFIALLAAFSIFSMSFIPLAIAGVLKN